MVTAAFNAADSIEQAVRSVARQAIPPLEHIVVDDGSTDGTGDILSRLADEYPNLRVIRQANRGAAAARNAGIEAARGKYIAFLDSDDLWLENKLQQQIGFMEESKRPFTYGNYTVINAETGVRLGQHHAPERLRYRDLLTRCPIGCSTAAYDQEALGKRYMPSVRRGQDWGLWLELTRDGTEAARYPGCEVLYYRRRGSLSRGKCAKAVDMYRIYSNEESLDPLSSLYYLARFTMNVMLKRPSKVTSAPVKTLKLPPAREGESHSRGS